jgi:hypothetical protein
MGRGRRSAHGRGHCQLERDSVLTWSQEDLDMSHPTAFSALLLPKWLCNDDHAICSLYCDYYVNEVYFTMITT